jgi:DNA-directed RNA polymerase subunit RPC12/RpoP
VAIQISKEDESRKGLIIKISIIVVALGVALYFTFRGGEEDIHPNTPESAEAYVCLDCGHQFKLTPREFHDLLDENKVQLADEYKAGSQNMVACPQCGKMTGVLARECPNHPGTFFPGRMADGTPGRCPTCGFAFYKR